MSTRLSISRGYDENTTNIEITASWSGKKNGRALTIYRQCSFKCAVLYSSTGYYYELPTPSGLSVRAGANDR